MVQTLNRASCPQRKGANSPCLTITRFRTDRSGLTMQPLTDLRLRSPLRLPYPRKQDTPVKRTNTQRQNDHTSESDRVWPPYPGCLAETKSTETSTPNPTGGLTSVHEEPDTSLSQNSLFHRETLLVATTHDLEDVTLELISELVTADLLGQSLIVKLAAEKKENTERKKSAENRNRTASPRGAAERCDSAWEQKQSRNPKRKARNCIEWEPRQEPIERNPKP